jgi:hypothetical protein
MPGSSGGYRLIISAIRSSKLTAVHAGSGGYAFMGESVKEGSIGAWKRPVESIQEVTLTSR